MYVDMEFMKPLFIFLEACQEVKQKAEHHPEGDVFLHSLQVLYWAFKESDDLDLILAAMLHDVGKLMKEEGHEQTACEMLEDYLSVKSLWLIEHHMRIWYLILGKMKRLGKVGYLIHHPWLPELILLARWDKLGRNPNKIIVYDREVILDKINKVVDKHFVEEKP